MIGLIIQIIGRRIKMTLKEAIESKRPFKRKDWECWYIVNELDEMCRLDCPNSKFYANAKAIFAEDWIIKEKWYEGDFKEKYPNGVLCKVWDKDEDATYTAIVINYDEHKAYPFITSDLDKYEFAEPITKDKAPAIIKEEKDD